MVIVTDLPESRSCVRGRVQEFRGVSPTRRLHQKGYNHTTRSETSIEKRVFVSATLYEQQKLGTHGSCVQEFGLGLISRPVLQNSTKSMRAYSLGICFYLCTESRDCGMFQPLFHRQGGDEKRAILIPVISHWRLWKRGMTPLPKTVREVDRRHLM